MPAAHRSGPQIGREEGRKGPATTGVEDMRKIKSGNQLDMLSRGKCIRVQVTVPDSSIWLQISKTQALQVLREVKADGRLRMEALEKDASLDLVVTKDR